jgi:hypothetical protein
MTEGRKTGEGQRQDPLAIPAAGVRDEPDPARIVLEPWVVERRDRGRSSSWHGRLRMRAERPPEGFFGRSS